MKKPCFNKQERQMLIHHSDSDTAFALIKRFKMLKFIKLIKSKFICKRKGEKF